MEQGCDDTELFVEDVLPTLGKTDFQLCSEQNQERIDTLIIQDRRPLHHRNTSRWACKAWLPVAAENTSRFSADATARNAHIGDHNI